MNPFQQAVLSRERSQSGNEFNKAQTPVKDLPAQFKTNQTNYKENPSGYFSKEQLQIFQQENSIQELGIDISFGFNIDQITEKDSEIAQYCSNFYHQKQSIFYENDCIHPKQEQPYQPNQPYQPYQPYQPNQPYQPYQPKLQLQKNAKKFITNPNKKNNQPKFIMRIFCQNIEQQRATYAGYGDLFKRVREKTMILYDWMVKDKKNHVSLKHLQNFFGNMTDSAEESLLNRIALRKILKSELKKEVIQNRQLKKKLHYLQAAKVYLLRCSSQSLSNRIQCQ